MCRVCAGFPANSVLTLRMRLGSSVSTDGRFGFAAHRAAEFVGGRPTAIFQTFPPSGRRAFVRAPSGRFIGAAFGGGDCRVPPRGGLRFSAHRAAQFVGGRPTASSFLACLRKEPKKGTRGFAPATPTPPLVGLRPKSAAPWSRISERAYSNQPAAAPRAQCLCQRVSGTVPGVLPGRHGRFGVARSAHGEAENCAASPRTRAERANARNGRCFPPWVLASHPASVVGCARNLN